MKRQIIYPGAIPLETDLLNTNKNTMVALGKLVAATFGTSTFANGLGCNPNSPAALNVVISPGEIYSLQNIDGTAYSSLIADTTHQIMKQGISLDAVTLACAAPGTAGQSINYLIQAAFSEVDSTPVVLPYYNASNPSQAYSGPANAGTTNNTARDGQVVLSAKAGVAATTGSQITPAADSGYVGLWVVTVANGQTTIVAGNIAQVTSAPFFGTAALLNVLNAFTVSPTAPTPATGDRTTKLATTAMFANEFAVSMATNGYQKLPSGLIIQWVSSGNVAIPAGVQTAVNATLPIAFPNALLFSSPVSFIPNSNNLSTFTSSLFGSLTVVSAAVNSAASQNINVLFLAIGR